MACVLITGANRGIGLELTERFLEEGWRVLACCRQPEKAKPLQRLRGDGSRLALHALDLLDDASITALARELEDEGIDLLINNAGVIGDPDRQTFGNMDYAAWLELFKVNTLAPMKLVEALIPNLEAGTQKHVVAITSGLASIANHEGQLMAYSCSKAALNSVMKSLSVVLKERGIRVNMLSPGWVRTDMGGADAPLSAQQSATMLYDNIVALGAEDTGLFIGIEGNLIPW